MQYIKINHVELATNLAHKKIHPQNLVDSALIIEVVNDKGQILETRYTDEGQKLFDYHYDEYYQMINDAKIKPAFTIPFG